MVHVYQSGHVCDKSLCSVRLLCFCIQGKSGNQEEAVKAINRGKQESSSWQNDQVQRRKREVRHKVFISITPSLSPPFAFPPPPLVIRALSLHDLVKQERLFIRLYYVRYIVDRLSFKIYFSFFFARVVFLRILCGKVFCNLSPCAGVLIFIIFPHPPLP